MLSLFRVAKVILFFEICKSVLYNFQTIFILYSAHSSYWLFIFNLCVISLVLVDLLLVYKQHFFTYSCIYTFFFVILQPQIRAIGFADIILKALISACFGKQKSGNFLTNPRQEGSKRPLGYDYPARRASFGIALFGGFHIRRGRCLLILIGKVFQNLCLKNKQR